MFFNCKTKIILPENIFWFPMECIYFLFFSNYVKQIAYSVLNFSIINTLYISAKFRIYIYLINFTLPLYKCFTLQIYFII